MFLDRIPPWAAVHESVELAKSLMPVGSDKFVNGVLRSLERHKSEITYPALSASPISHISLYYSHPGWMVKRWMERYGPQETMKLCEANNYKPPISIRANLLKTNRETLSVALRKEGAGTSPSKIAPDGLTIESEKRLDELTSYREGMFYVQDEASMLASYILDPKPGEVVLDLCSAPGGKATHIAELMENRGKVIALDVKEGRLKLIDHNCLRLGINIVETRCLDGRRAGRIDADRVIVDAPCSNLGTIRHHPDVKWNSSPDEIPLLARLQEELLAGGARNLKAGGVMVYSTCTIEPEENESVVGNFLTEHVNFRLEAMEFGNLQSDGMLNLYPHRHGTDGFFIARLRRLR
jgi:16S rRNA (cytosine967-C5)-methyltransferase